MPGFFFESGSSPDRPPDALGDDALEICIEFRLVRLSPRDVLGAQHRFTHSHPFVEAIVSHGVPPLTGIALKLSDRSTQCQIEKISNDQEALTSAVHQT
jgi:hypothetical protein